jgi:prepilin-type N-terminal cleavage/methylation domain-containing protein
MTTARKRRPGVTLLEVLVTIFIMGVGMLALLTLFPVGAVSIARALKDDRCATCAGNADSIGWAQNIRNDPLVTPYYLGGPPTTFTAVTPLGSGPSYGVYVDPQGIAGGFPASVGALAGVTQGIPRVSMSLTNYTARNTAGNTQLSVSEAARWCSLLDDIVFTTDAVPDTTSGGVQRYGVYTWAWLLRQTSAGSTPPVIQAYVIVYRGRSTTTFNGEKTYPASGSQYETSVTVNGTDLPLRTGTWILDTTTTSTNAVPGYFYRVVDYNVNTSTNQTVLQLDSPLRGSVSVITVMENVAEVFYRDTFYRGI